MYFGVSCCLGKHLGFLLNEGQKEIKRIKAGVVEGFILLTVSVKL